MSSFVCDLKNKKGFTLIEILAVVVIIGIIGIIGIMSVSSYIEDSRKTVFMEIAKDYLDQAKTMKANDELYHDPRNTEAVLIPLSEIKLEDHDGDTGYGKVDLNNSYVIIVNEKGKYHYYITMMDDSGHAFVIENINTLSKDRILSSQDKIGSIVSLMVIRDSNNELVLEIGEVKYQLSDKNILDENGNINTQTILLDNSILGEFEVDWEYGWTNDDKVITVETFTEEIEYEYYISTRSQKPLASDAGWQESNEFVKDLGTYYVFVKSNDNEISEPEEVVIEKIDRVAPTCTLKINGTASSHGIYNADFTVLFDSLTDGAESPTTSGIKNRGIVVKGGSLDADNEDLNVEVSEVKTTTYLGYVEDRAGNTNTCEVDVKTDGIKPTIAYSLATGLYNSAQNVVITPSDGNGVIDYYDVTVKKDGATIGTYTNIKTATYTLSLSSDGKYSITTKAYDTGANSNSKTIEYQIDKTKPTCTLTASGTKSTGDYYGTDVDISFSVTNDPKETGASYASGVKSYGLDSTTGAKATKLTTDTESKTYTGYIIDNAGNQNTCTITVKRKSNFTISYSTDGGAACSNKAVVFNQAYGSLCSTTKTGYTFVSWNTDSELTKAVTATSIFKNESSTLYAKWAANTYKVTFNANSGSTPTASKNVSYNSTYGELPTPTRSGYTFLGWYTAASGGDLVTSSTKVTILADQTLYAHWKANTYTISFNGNGNTGGSMSTLTCNYGSACTLTTNGFSKTNYVFVGWATSSSGSVVYTNSQSVTDIGNKTLYAIWVLSVKNYGYTGGIQSYTVSYSGSYKLEVWGAQGGNSGAKGGYSSGTVSLTKGTVLYIGVGGAGGVTAGGYNGGGAGGTGNGHPNGGGGGGATHIAKTNNRGILSSYNSYRSEVLIVAGGGGGNGGAYENGTIALPGGAGGGTTGASSGYSGHCTVNYASGATQSSGYAFGQGQKGRNATNSNCGAEGNGGGGGGYFGGYAISWSGDQSDAGGGGGSGYIGGVSSGSTTSGVRSGNGYARITFIG